MKKPKKDAGIDFSKAVKTVLKIIKMTGIKAKQTIL